MSIKSKVTQRTLQKIEEITQSKLTLGKLIWAIRQADEVTQVDFAKKLHISRQQLCDVEHERKIVSPKLAAHYAEILGYSKAQFIQLALQGMIDKDHLGVDIEVNQKHDEAA